MRTIHNTTCGVAKWALNVVAIERAAEATGNAIRASDRLNRCEVARMGYDEFGQLKEGNQMTTDSNKDVSFAETALRLGGKTEEEARKTGAVDRADDQVEAMFAEEYKTVNSPIHRAVWDDNVPIDLFTTPSR